MVCGVVISALQVVEAGFGVVDVAAVAQGVTVDEAGRGGSPSGGGIRGHVAPRVVGVIAVGLVCVSLYTALASLSKVSPAPAPFPREADGKARGGRGRRRPCGPFTCINEATRKKLTHFLKKFFGAEKIAPLLI